jgi:hypothetical protein
MYFPLKKGKEGLGTVARACNPSYLEEQIWKITVQSQPRQKVCKTPFQPIKAGHGGVCLSFQLYWKGKQKHCSLG